MNISDLMILLAKRFPRYVDEIAGWRDSYSRVLGRVAPGPLTDAVNATLDAWEKSIPPKPADFARHVPANATSGTVKPEWWHGAGKRAAELHARKRRMIDDAMRWHEAQIAEHAERYRPDGQVFVDCVLYEIGRAAEAAIFGTVKDGPTREDQISLTADQWASAHMRAETRVRSIGMGTALQRAVRPAYVALAPSGLRQDAPKTAQDAP